MKTNSVSNTHMKGFDLLSEDEVKLWTLLKGVKSTTLLSMVIRRLMEDESVERFRSLVETLRSQGEDSPRGMEKTVGKEAMTLLMGKEYGKMSGSCRQFCIERG